MTDIARLFQAFLAPAIFVSATALLILSINVRLMGIVSRLRQYVHAKHDAAKNDRVQEAEAYTAQISAIEQRAEMIRRCFLFVLISLAGTITSCLLLGFGLYWKEAAVAAVVVFVLAMICLLAGTFYYMREITIALSSVHNEARDSRFMDLGAILRLAFTTHSDPRLIPIALHLLTAVVSRPHHLSTNCQIQVTFYAAPRH